MLWDLEQAPEVMRFYAEFIKGAPEDINGFFLFLVVPPGPPFPESLHNRKMCGIVWCFAGPPDRFEEAFRPVRRFRKPAFEFVGPMPYPALQSMFDALYPPGLQWYWKADFVNDLGDEAIRLHVKHGSELPTPLSIDAPVPDQRRGAPGGWGRHSPGAIATPRGPRSSSGSIRIRRTRTG